MAAMINCPYCGKLTDPKLENCPHCGGPMRAKVPTAPRRAAATPHHCPSCGSAVQDGDIICVRCGTNLLTGQKIAEEQRAPATQEKRRWPVVVAGLVIVAVIVVVAVLFVVLSRNPIAEAQELSGRGEHLQAINVLQAYVAGHSDDAAAYLLLGQIYWKAQQYPNAAEAFKQASVLDPKNVKSALYEVVALSRTPGSPQAEQVAALERLVEADPANPQARYLLGLAQGIAKNYGGQVAALESMASAPELGTKVMLGVARALDKQYDAAFTDLKDALSTEPQDGDAAAALGFVAYNADDTPEAIRLFGDALQKGTSIDLLVKTRLGMLLMSQGNYIEALPLLTAAKDNRAAAPEAPFYHALCLAAIGQDNEAVVALESISTGNSELADEAATELVAIHLAQADIAHAEESLYKAQQSGKPSAKLYTLQGQIQSAKGQVTDAQQSFRQAVQADPDYPAAHLEQGLLFVQREVLPDGIRELERYLQLIGTGTAGGRRNEIELLLTQLKQTAGG